jgi:hypothetical protein
MIFFGRTNKNSPPWIRRGAALAAGWFELFGKNNHPASCGCFPSFERRGVFGDFLSRKKK